MNIFDCSIKLIFSNDGANDAKLKKYPDYKNIDLNAGRLVHQGKLADCWNERMFLDKRAALCMFRKIPVQENSEPKEGASMETLRLL